MSELVQYEYTDQYLKAIKKKTTIDLIKSIAEKETQIKLMEIEILRRQT